MSLITLAIGAKKTIDEFISHKTKILSHDFHFMFAKNKKSITFAPYGEIGFSFRDVA